MTPGLLQREQPGALRGEQPAPPVSESAPRSEPATERPALLAGEERDVPDRHIFRGID
ncbi:hypothetical protein ACWCV9_36220 [Streptomyces sp. NPDC001606]